MNRNLFAVSVVLVGLTVCAADAKKPAYVDPNPYAGYGKAMAVNPQFTMGVDWDLDNAPQLARATSDEALEAIVSDDGAVARLLRQVKPDYKTCPLAACQIAAVSQYVMANAEAPWYAFWRSSRADARRRWTKALLTFAKEAEDGYVKEYYLDQLRWCGYPHQAPCAMLAAYDAAPNVRAFAANVATELVQASKAEPRGCPLGTWALYLPFDAMKAGHVIIEKGEDGKPHATLLWRWGSPFAVEDVKLCKGGFELRFGNHKPKDLPQDKSAWRTSVVVARVFGKRAYCTYYKEDGNGKRVTPAEPFAAVRNPKIGPKPCLAKLTYGTPVKLLAGSMDDFVLMEANKKSGWTLKDGVLSNRINRDAAGKPMHNNGNLRTKRADFRDFKLTYDVRVLPGCNSGVYLRGIYEIQVFDSYGQPVDCHNMAAVYGRITPTVAAEKPAGEWQHVEVTLVKRHATVVLNGKTIIDNQPIAGVTGGAMTPNEFTFGPLYIQGDHSDADYRNMVLTPIVGL